MKKIKKFILDNKEFFIGIFFLMVVQGILFWFLKLFQKNPIYLYHPLDDKIPFIGLFVYIYNMFYPFVFLSLYWLYKKDEKAYFKAVIAGVMGYLICDIIFLFMPTIMYRAEFDSIGPLTDLVIKITYLADNPPLNCFPSIHCLFCFQVIYSYLFSKYNDNKKKFFIILFLILIILSTLFVKQHFVYDVIGSLLVCLITNMIVEVFGLYDRIIKRRK